MTILPWHSTQWLAINERIAQARIPHAMLFHGAQGIGKWQFVQALASRLLCSNVKDNMACDNCDACHLLAVNNHPDLKIISCEDDKKNISIDQIRNVIEYLSLTPHSSQNKIAIVNQAELMTTNAANSLLKTLEEPPKSALIFLITHRPDQLLPTILSRCQKIHFQIPTRQQSEEFLAPQVPDLQRRSALLALANGAPLKALDYEQKGALEQREKQISSLLDLSRGQLDPVSAAESWLKLDLELSLYTLVGWVADLARLKSTNAAPVITNSDSEQILQKFIQKASLQEILKYHVFLQECLQWSKSNMNIQMLLEDILIRWTRLFKLESE